ILAADLVGYSRLVEADEVGTVTRVLDIVKNTIRPIINAHSGRVIKLMGDGVLAEFHSVVEAVNCAIAIKSTITERYSDMPEGREIHFRYGINLGDVIVEDDDVYGHGVNVAARLESLAEPDEIYISRPVRDQIRDRVDCYLEDKGNFQVKNIRRPVRVFRVVDDPDEAAPMLAEDRARSWRWRRAAIFAGVVAGFLAIDLWPASSPGPLNPETTLAVEALRGNFTLQLRSNIRLGPGTDFRIARTLNAGATLPVTGEITHQGDLWYQVTVPGTQEPLFVFSELGEMNASERLVLLPVARSDVIGDDASPTKAATEAQSADQLALLPKQPHAGFEPSVVSLPAVANTIPEDAGAILPARLEPSGNTLLTEQDDTDALWVRISMDLTTPYMPDCNHHDIDGLHRIPLGTDAVWQEIGGRNGRSFDLSARAYEHGQQVVLEVLPFASEWEAEDAIRFDFNGTEPGQSGSGFADRRAGAPHAQCGTFAIYVDLAEEPDPTEQPVD
ncbi:MAG: adenylate/guanylate cyclase domain-containing protein, partial [Pseudomonadota bacterium]